MHIKLAHIKLAHQANTQQRATHENKSCAQTFIYLPEGKIVRYCSNYGKGLCNLNVNLVEHDIAPFLENQCCKRIRCKMVNSL